jgi:hypothetical protein
MDLIDKEDRPSVVTVPKRRRFLDRCADIFHSGQDRSDREKLSASVSGDHLRERGFSRSGRSREDERTQLIGDYRPTEKAPGTEDVVLTNELIERPRSHPSRERLIGEEVLHRLRFEELFLVASFFSVLREFRR